MDWTRFILYGFFVYVFWFISGSGIFPKILFPLWNGNRISESPPIVSLLSNYSLEPNEFKVKAIGSKEKKSVTY